MKKWFLIIPTIIAVVFVLSLRSSWPKPSMGTICTNIPKLEEYLVKTESGTLKNVDMDSNKMAKEEMERELLAATGSAVNFAGKFVIVNHECGLGCQKHAVIDQQTTKIIFYGLQSSKLFDYKINSNLVKADNRYYEFKNNEMDYLCETVR